MMGDGLLAGFVPSVFPYVRDVRSEGEGGTQMHSVKQI